MSDVKATLYHGKTNPYYFSDYYLLTFYYWTTFLNTKQNNPWVGVERIDTIHTATGRAIIRIPDSPVRMRRVSLGDKQ